MFAAISADRARLPAKQLRRFGEAAERPATIPVAQFGEGLAAVANCVGDEGALRPLARHFGRRRLREQELRLFHGDRRRRYGGFFPWLARGARPVPDTGFREFQPIDFAGDGRARHFEVIRQLLIGRAAAQHVLQFLIVLVSPIHRAISTFRLFLTGERRTLDKIRRSPFDARRRGRAPRTDFFASIPDANPRQSFPDRFTLRGRCGGDDQFNEFANIVAGNSRSRAGIADVERNQD